MACLVRTSAAIYGPTRACAVTRVMLTLVQLARQMSSTPAAQTAAVKTRVAAKLTPAQTGILPPRKPVRPRKVPSKMVRPTGPLAPIVADHVIRRSVSAHPPNRMSASAALGIDAAAALARRVGDTGPGAGPGAGQGAEAGRITEEIGSVGGTAGGVRAAAASGSDSEPTIDVFAVEGEGSARTEGRGSGSSSGGAISGSSSGRTPAGSSSDSSSANAVRFTSGGSSATPSSAPSSSEADGSSATATLGSALILTRRQEGRQEEEGGGAAGRRKARRVKMSELPEAQRKRFLARRDALSALSFAFPPGVTADTLFAIVNLAGRQYKVTEGDIIQAEFIPGAAVQSSMTLPVALLGSRGRTVVGRPTVPRAHVLVTVEEHARDVKLVVFKKKRRKRYQRTQGHRRDVTRLRVTAISADLATY